MMLFVALLLLASGCGSAAEKAARAQVAELDKAVMAVHDTAMERMQRISKAKRELETYRTELEKKKDKAGVAVCDKALAALKNADNAMHEWMSSYTQPADTAAAANAINYLQQQKAAIENVQRVMDESVAAANALIKK